MFQRIVGLDIGSTSIKVVLAQKGLKGITIDRCVEYPWPHAKSEPEDRGHSRDLPKALKSSLSQAGISSGLHRESVIVSVPERMMHTRRIRLPFADPQQVAQTIPFEMEGQIPVDLEETIVEYHPVQDRAHNGSRSSDSTLLVTALSRGYLRKHLKSLQDAGVDPKALEVDCLALFNFSQHFFKDVDGDIALVEIGATKTAVCVSGDGSPHMIRTLWTGGDHLTQEISRSMDVGREEAEEMKKQIRLEDSRAEQQPPAGVVLESLKPLIHQLRMTFHAYETETGRSIRHLYVCGGSARMPGLAAFLSRALGLVLLASPSLRGAETFTAGVGLALKECLGTRASRIRFRSGEFAYRREEAKGRRRLKVLGVVGLILLLLGAGDLYMHYHLKASRYQDLKDHVRSLFQQTFPEVRTIVNEIEQTRVAHRELVKTNAFLGGAAVSTLDLLMELTKRNPSDMPVEVQNILFEKATIRVDARAVSFAAAEKFKESLGEYEGFQEVQITDAKMSADQSTVHFQVSITLVEGI